MVKVLVLGIDGASWNFIEEWIEKGKLPTFKKMRENGVWGDLESCVYYFTSPAWKCYSTGKNPGKLGAFAYWNFDKNEKKILLNTSVSFQGQDIWDILGMHGYTSGVVNMPLTYPPKKINGILIAGFPALEYDYTYPPELEKKLKKKYDYRVGHLGGLDYGEKTLSEIKDLIEKPFLVSRDLLRENEFDFFQVVIFYIDKIQHDYWKAMEDNDPIYGNVIKKFWEFIDKEMAKLFDMINDDCYVFVVSDHGFVSLKGVIRLNEWLKDKGYLCLQSRRFRIEDIFDFLETVGLKKDLVARIAASSNLIKLIRWLLPDQLIQKLEEKALSRGKEMGITTVVENIDWTKTKAICIAENCVYIVKPDIHGKFRDKLIEEIENLKDPRTGKKIVKAVKKCEDIYFGNYTHIAPDLIIIPEDGYRFYDGMQRGIWDFSSKPWSGYHRLHGIFLAKGPQIKKSVKVKNVTIYDIAPTILHIFGIPIPKDMDGRVLTEIFES